MCCSVLPCVYVCLCLSLYVRASWIKSSEISFFVHRRHRRRWKFLPFLCCIFRDSHRCFCLPKNVVNSIRDIRCVPWAWFRLRIIHARVCTLVCHSKIVSLSFSANDNTKFNSFAYMGGSYLTFKWCLLSEHCAEVENVDFKDIFDVKRKLNPWSKCRKHTQINSHVSLHSLVHLVRNFIMKFFPRSNKNQDLKRKWKSFSFLFDREWNEMETRKSKHNFCLLTIVA